MFIVLFNFLSVILLIPFPFYFNVNHINLPINGSMQPNFPYLNVTVLGNKEFMLHWGNTAMLVLNMQINLQSDIKKRCSKCKLILE